MSKEKQTVKPDPIPRFDVKRTYPFQFRVFGEEGDKKIHVAIVAADTPGLFLLSKPKVFMDVGTMQQDDEAILDLSFFTYFWEDCEADGNLTLATHRIDWTVHAEWKLAVLFPNSKGKATKDSGTTIFPDPPIAEGTSYHKAGINDPGVDSGFTPVPGQLIRTVQ